MLIIEDEYEGDNSGIGRKGKYVVSALPPGAGVVSKIGTRAQHAAKP